MSVDHNKNIFEVKNVSFYYGKNLVLKDISFDVHEGDYLGLIGPNGSGKTTLIKIMLGLIKPSSGQINVFGKPISEFRDWSEIGYVAQKAVNFDPLFPVTVKEVVMMGKYADKGIGKRLTREDLKKVDEAIEQVELSEYKNRMIGDLSGGQQQRVFIARALAGDPKIIFLDEPTAGVDVKTQEQFYALLKKLNNDLSLTLVLVSHEVDVIVNQLSEVACINQSLVYHGKPKDFVKGDFLESLYGKHSRFMSHDH